MAQANRYTGKSMQIGLKLLNAEGTDSSASAYHGVVTGTPTWGAGKYGFGMIVSTNQDYIALPTGPFNFGAEANWTIEAWLKGSTAAARIALSSSTANQVWIGYTATGTFCCHINGTGDFEDLTLDSAVDGTDGEWHHVAMVMTAGTSLKLFVDGELTATETGVFISPGAAATGKVGKDFLEFKTAWVGAIDEIAFWNSAKYTTTFVPPTAAHADDAANLNAIYHMEHVPLQADYKSLSIKEGIESADGTAGSDTHEFSVPTYNNAEITVELLKVTSDDQYYADIAASMAPGLPAHLFWAPEGPYTPGLPLYGVTGFVESVDTDIKFDDMVGMKFTFRGTEAIYDFDV